MSAVKAEITQGAISIPLHARMGLTFLQRAQYSVVSMELSDET